MRYSVLNDEMKCPKCLNSFLKLVGSFSVDRPCDRCGHTVTPHEVQAHLRSAQREHSIGKSQDISDSDAILTEQRIQQIRQHCPTGRIVAW